MKKKMMLGVLLSFAVYITACENVVRTNENSEIEDPRERWEAWELSDYSIEQSRLCFCLGPHGFVKLTVENGEITEGKEVENGAAVPQDRLQYFQTVDEVFDWIEQENARTPKPAKLTVEYDEKYGYPTKIEYDFSLMIADDELWIEMRSLKF